MIKVSSPAGLKSQINKLRAAERILRRDTPSQSTSSLANGLEIEIKERYEGLCEAALQEVDAYMSRNHTFPAATVIRDLKNLMKNC